MEVLQSERCSEVFIAKLWKYGERGNTVNKFNRKRGMSKDEN